MRAVIVGSMGLLLAACASQPTANFRTADASRDAPTAQGMARVYVYVGRTYWNGGSQPTKFQSFDIGVDDVVVGRVASGQVLTLDLPTGRYRITRYQHTIWGPMYPVTDQLTVAAGEQRYIAASHYQTYGPDVAFAAGLLGGAIGGLIVGEADASGSVGDKPAGDYFEESATGVQDILDLKLVKPNPAKLAEAAR